MKWFICCNIWKREEEGSIKYGEIKYIFHLFEHMYDKTRYNFMYVEGRNYINATSYIANYHIDKVISHI